MGTPPRVLVWPTGADYAVQAVRQGGGEVVSDGEAANALVWSNFAVDGLLDVLGAHRGVRWAQLPMAGVERLFEQGVFASPEAKGVTWTCAKGSYSRPVAEHALCLALAGLRQLPERAPVVGKAGRHFSFRRASHDPRRRRDHDGAHGVASSVRRPRHRGAQRR